MGIYRCAACGAVNRSAAGAGARCERCRAALDTSGAPQRVDAAALVSLVASAPAPLLVGFAAPGARCACLDEVAPARAGDLLCLSVDTAREPAAAVAYSVHFTPTVVLFDRGAEVGRMGPGASGGPAPAPDEVARWVARLGA